MAPSTIAEMRALARKLKAAEDAVDALRAARDDAIRRAPADLSHSEIARAVEITRQRVKQLRDGH